MSKAQEKDLRDQILEANDCEPIPYEVKEWKTTIYVKVMDGEELFDFQDQAAKIGKRNTPRDNFLRLACLMCFCVVDKHGKRVFDKPTDLEKVNKKNPRVVKRVAEFIISVNKMSADEVDLETKNS